MWDTACYYPPQILKWQKFYDIKDLVWSASLPVTAYDIDKELDGKYFMNRSKTYEFWLFLKQRFIELSESLLTRLYGWVLALIWLSMHIAQRIIPDSVV